jgi:hypothetical protein
LFGFYHEESRLAIGHAEIAPAVLVQPGSAELAEDKGRDFKGRKRSWQIHLPFYPGQSPKHARAVKIAICIGTLIERGGLGELGVSMDNLNRYLYDLDPVFFDRKGSVGYNLMRSAVKIPSLEQPEFVKQISYRRAGGECRFQALPHLGFWFAAFERAYERKKNVRFGQRDYEVLRRYHILQPKESDNV